MLCEKDGKIHLVNFLVSDVPLDKPPLLCGRDAQTFGYLKINADEVHTVEKMNEPTNLRPPANLTKESVLQHKDVFKPRRDKSLGEPLHIEIDPN